MTDVFTTISDVAAESERRSGTIDVLSGVVRRRIVGAILMAIDGAAAFIALHLGVWLAAAIPLAGAPGAVLDPRLASALLVAIFFALGLYTGVGPGPCERFRLRAIGTLLFTGANLLLAAQTVHLGAHLLQITCSGLLTLVAGHYAEMMVRNILVRCDLWGARTALVGCGSKSRNLAKLLLAHPELGLRPIGFIALSGERKPPDQPALPLLGMAHRGRQPDIEVMILTSSRHLGELDALPSSGPSPMRTVLVRNAAQMHSLWLQTRSFGGAVGIESSRGLHSAWQQLLKRGLDLILAVPAAVLLSPLILVLAAAIKLTDAGPAFHVQERVGRHGRSLRIYKIRTMYQNAEERLSAYLEANPLARVQWHRYYKLSNDPRILPRVGEFIRRFSLDELPQLWNVIRGDMTLVGPRPFPAYHFQRFDEHFRSLRSSVTPGLTGMWQVSSRSDGDLELQKAEDLFYIRNWSFYLDLYILLQTVPAVLGAKGAR